MTLRGSSSMDPVTLECHMPLTMKETPVSVIVAFHRVAMSIDRGLKLPVGIKYQSAFLQNSLFVSLGNS